MINITVVLLNIQKHRFFAAALCIFAPVFIINITTFLFSNLPMVSFILWSLICHFTAFLNSLPYLMFFVTFSTLPKMMLLAIDATGWRSWRNVPLSGFEQTSGTTLLM